MPEDTPSNLTERDVAALTRAIAETLYRVEKRSQHRKGVGQDLYFSVNPWCTPAANTFLDQVIDRLESYREEMNDQPGSWGH